MATNRLPGAALLRRRRISHACDQCHELRTRCNGQRPCSHCVDYTLVCEYARERKKRGRAAERPAQSQTKHNSFTSKSQATEKSVNTNLNTKPDTRVTVSATASATQVVFAAAIPEELSMQSHESVELPCLQTVTHEAGISHSSLHIDQCMMEFSEFNTIDIEQTARMESDMLTGFSVPFQPPPQSPGAQSISQSAHSLSSTVPQDDPATESSPSNTSGSGRGRGQSSQPFAGCWDKQPRDKQTNDNHTSPLMSTLTYPVLRPILGHLNGIMPVKTACDLLEFYFSSSWSAHMHPASPYVLGFVFRKASILHTTDPRPCQQALIASMIWVAAQTSDLGMLAGLPHARERLCTTLMNLTLKLLKSPASQSVNNDAMQTSPEPGTGGVDPGTSSSLPWDTCQLDNIVTYIHLAVVVSASELKGASIKWWSMAWELARQLKLGREVAPCDVVGNSSTFTLHNAQNHENTAGQWTILEEQREERRRVWWLLYAVDRHLALCYNRPLTLLDAECQDLLQPIDDTAWQSGNFRTRVGNDASDGHNKPKVGPQIRCTGYGIFGYFVPLMTILGDIVDLQHSKNHPRLGVNGRAEEMWNMVADSIRIRLQVYERSLDALEGKTQIGGTVDSGYLMAKPPNYTGAVAGQLGAFSNNDSNMDRSSTACSDTSTILVTDINLVNGHGTNVNTDPNIDSNITHVANDSDESSNTRLAEMVPSSISSHITENEIYTRMVIAYSRHVLHVLHILLAGRWDPVALFDERNPWISTHSFITATGHAVSAAEEIARILQFDPGLEFMPFFWGIYLLQGSFLPLLIADMLQRQTSPHIVKACEMIMQAHEASVVTLRTEYQRDFSKLMRTAIAGVRGRVPSDLEKHHKWRKELLSRYRWHGKGTGLVL